MFYNLSGDFRSPFVLFKYNLKLLFSKQIFYHSLRVVRPGSYIFVSVRDRLGSSSDLLKCLGGGGSVAVACGVRLSCSVFIVHSVLLSVSLVARALYIALRLQVYKRREQHDM